MTGGGQEQPRLADGAERRLFAQEKRGQTTGTPTNYDQHNHQDDHLCNYKFKRESSGDDEDELLSEALLAVASAEEYAAKIIKLQQACLTPLKEDLADWLNKIMNMSSITTDNFMDKLDNGVIICRLAKIISLWCEQQLATATNNDLQYHAPNISPQQAPAITSSHLKLDQANYHLHSQSNPSSKLSSSISNVHSPINCHDTTPNVENYEPFQQNCNGRKNSATILATPLRQPQSRPVMFTDSNGPNGLLSRSSLQSKNCLISSSTTSLNSGCAATGNQFTSNLIRMEQTKIWEDAKCRTFYARDNVCNFIKWSKEFGVNQSVLFESDDLVLHANTRQVVLCLLDVARIACVKYGFTEAPGLVKFEQEIDRELAAEKAAAFELQSAQSFNDGYDENRSSGDKQQQNNDTPANRNLSSLTRNSRVGSLADATDDLIMRYCLHKEEEAAKKKAAAAELEAKVKAEEVEKIRLAAEEAAAIEAEATRVAAEDSVSTVESQDQIDSASGDGIDQSVDESQTTTIPFEVDSLTSVQDAQKSEQDSPNKLPTESIMQKNNLNYDNRVDSLDSGEGRTESASTSHSRAPVTGSKTPKASCIPMPIKRSTSNSSLISNQTSSMGTSELSSSRSSLLSGQDISSAKRHVASDLDGKVMRIAKSYYGKAATKGVTRLSEGKYKIADRIVFVRLLKGHLVMVRIGGGWDTLENFLFRHKSDPSQVIDVDNLLPLETKMSFEKNPQLTPTTSNKFSKLPYYRRSSSASSTNLSTSNLSVSNHSPTSSSAASTTTSSSNNNAPIGTPSNQQDGSKSSHQRSQSSSNKQQIPCLLIHRGQNPSKITTPQTAFYTPNQESPQPARGARGLGSRTPNAIRYTTNRPLGSSRTPTASTNNLYPATLTTRLATTGIKGGLGGTKVNSTTNLHSGSRTPKQETFRKLGQSNDSLQASYLRSPQHNNLALGTRRKIETHRRSTNGLVRQSNSVNS